MIIKARINQNKVYNLVRWNALDFNANLTLIIQSVDLVDIRNTFEHVDKLEILQDDVLIATYTSLDTYSQITYLGKEYVEGEKTFSDAMSVTLTKTDIIDQVQRLDEQINPIVDPTTMSLAELKQYKLKQVSEACSETIYSGATIELDDGTQQHFEYNIHDQLNLDELFIISMIAPEVTLLPYHQSHDVCHFYTKAQIITIVVTLMLKKTREVTYCNQLTQYVRSIKDKDTLLEVEYGMELPEEYEAIVEQIMSNTIAQVQEFLSRIMPNEQDEIEPSDEPEVEPSDEPESENN